MNRAYPSVIFWLSRTVAIATVVMVGICCLASEQLAHLPFERAIDCAERGEGPFPFEKAICRQHVFWLRGSRADIAALQASEGAVDLLTPKSPSHTVQERWEMLKFLSSHGLNVDAKQSDQWTLLHAAIRDNNVEGVALLLRLHPDLGIKAGPDEKTPLQLAQELHRIDIVRRILAEYKAQKRELEEVKAQEKRLENAYLMDAEWGTAQFWMSPSAQPPPVVED